MGLLLVYGLPIFSTLLTIILSFILYNAWKAKSDIKDEINRLKAVMEFDRKLGWYFIGIAVANGIDFNFMFPFPLVGLASEYFSAILLVIGAVILFRSHRPKINEVLTLAARSHGYLTQVFIMTKLGLPESIVERTMRSMVRSKLVKIINPVSKQSLSDIVFLVRSYSGSTRNENGSQNTSGEDASPLQPEVDSRIANLGVDEVTDRLLRNTLHVGPSGRAV